MAYVPASDTLLVANSFFLADTGLFRFQADGTPAFTYGGGGSSSIAVLPSGKILIAGAGAAARFNADGSLDFSYSTDGSAQAANAVDVQPALRVYGPSTDDGGSAILPDGSVITVSHFVRAAPFPADSTGPI